MIKWLFAKYLALKGWTYKNEIGEDIGSFVAIGGPHTSNWDFVVAMGMLHHIRFVTNKFLIKSTWMRFPLSLFFGSLGAVAVDREAIAKNEGQNTTEEFSKLFHAERKIALWISPEGSRSRREKWKTGFYYIALKAKVPIVMGYCDYSKKIIGMGKVIQPSGDIEADMIQITNFYKDIKGHTPSNFSVDKRYLDKRHFNEQ